MPQAAGIDVGTAFTKAVIVAAGCGEEAPLIVGRGSVRSGVDMDGAAAAALSAALGDAGISRAAVDYIVATGFGRYSVSFRDIQATEITSGARGVRHFYPDAGAVLDIGSQSTRAIALTPAGKVRAFKTNDKCAAGSGSFIVRAAKYLQLTTESVGELALRAANPQPISSVCAVLAESEIINHVSAGVAVEDILRGIYESLADRAGMLLKRTAAGTDVIFIGGVARQAGMIAALQARLGIRVLVPEHCEYVCAVGAALLGLKRKQTHSPVSLAGRLG